MRLTVCNQCKKQQPAIAVFDWIKTEIIGASTETFSDRPIEGEFCSDECVVEYFKKRKSDRR